MKIFKLKKILALIIILIVIAIGVFIALSFSKDDVEKSENEKRELPEVIQKTACELFPLEDAKRIIGEDIIQANPTTPTFSSQSPPADNSTNAPAPVEEHPASKSIEQSDNPETANASSSYTQNNQQAQKKASICIYSDQDRSSDVSITVLTDSYDQLRKNFDAMRPEGAQQLSGYGEDAYWRSGKDFSGKEYGQLVVLETGGLVSVSGGSADLDLSKRVVDVIKEKL